MSANSEVLDLMSHGNTVAAMTALRAAHEEDPALLLNKALYHAWQGLDPERLWQTRADHRALLARSTGPQLISLLFNLGCLALAQDDVAEACLRFQDVLRLDGGHVRALHNLGYANELMAEYDLALSTYQQALVLRPDFVISRINLALLQINTGESEGGLAALRDLAEADPENAGVVLYLCRALLAEKQTDSLTEVLVVLGRCPDTPVTPELLECRAYAEVRLGKREQAEGTFRTLVSEDSDNAFARLGMMQVLAERGDFSGLLEHAEVYHRLEPSERTQRLLDRLNAL